MLFFCLEFVSVLFSTIYPCLAIACYNLSFPHLMQARYTNSNNQMQHILLIQEGVLPKNNSMIGIKFSHFIKILLALTGALCAILCHYTSIFFLVGAFLLVYKVCLFENWMQSDADWCRLILIDADWCWLMLIDADWCLLIGIGCDWYWNWLMLINANWWWLILIDAD